MDFEAVVASLRYSPRTPKEHQWLIDDENGWTVAHQWVIDHVMPADFEHWAVSDSSGWTVAHAAASARKLPDDFNQWHLADKNGDTVAHIAVRSGRFDVKKFGIKILTIRNNAGVSVNDEVILKHHPRFDSLKSILAS